MKRIVFCAIVLLSVVAVANGLLIDQVAVQPRDIVKITQTCNNTTTTFKVYVGQIDEYGLLHLRITKNDVYLMSPSLMAGDSVTFGKVKLTYVEISDIPFLKIYGFEGVKYNVTKISPKSSEEATGTNKPSVNVSIIPYPLIPGKKFIVMVEGLSRGKIVMVDPNGWVFSKTFSQSDIIMGDLPEDVGNQIALRVLDPYGKTVLSEVLKVRTEYYEQVSATIVPQKPIKGGGLVVMLSEPISGTAMIIDSFTGLSNTTTVANGIAIFHIPEDFGGPIILRVMDTHGRVIYQTILQMSNAQLSSSGKLTLTLSKTMTTVNSPVMATLTMNGKLVDGKIYIEDEAGAIIKTVDTVNGKATIKLSDEGTYTVYAKAKGMKSNEVTLKVNPTPLTIQVTTPNPKPNKPVTISITKGATYIITGAGLTTPIEGTSSGVVTFTPPQEGTYTITATLNGQQKTVTINVKKTYQISAVESSGFFGDVIKVSVVDSEGMPANGAVSVRYPNGMTLSFPLMDGETTIPVSGNGEYIIMFKGASKSIYVRNAGNNSAIPILLVVLVVGGCIAYIFKTNKFGVRDKVSMMVKKKKVDVLQ